MHTEQGQTSDGALAEPALCRLQILRSESESDDGHSVCEAIERAKCISRLNCLMDCVD